MRRESFDFVVIGSGFAGAIMSMVLRRLGKTVLLLERGSHPRFAIGESSTPFANLLLERLATDFDLPFLRSCSEWGSWQENFPHLPVGLKRGFTFYHHTPGQPLDLSDRSRQLLVAASPNDSVADTHWYRPGFDAFLVEQAQKIGVEFRDNITISDVQNDRARWSMTVASRTEDAEDQHASVETTDRTKTRVTASFLIDATGGGGFAPVGSPKIQFPFMPKTSAIYAHFRGVRRVDEIPGLRHDPALPYPPDDAAVHHLFPGGWIWILRFNNGITSAGAAFLHESIPPATDPGAIWFRLLQELPGLRPLFESAKPVTPLYFTPELGFRRTQAAGPNWALLPSAAGFVDPLLSTGFALTLLGIVRLAQALRANERDLIGYEWKTFEELDATADLVSALYSKLADPDDFSLLSLLYFAAMSYSETAWRLEKPHLASGFLLTNNATFSAARHEICATARAGQKISRKQIASLIEPYDVAGLTDWSRNRWYPVKLKDLADNAHKLGANPGHIDRLIAKLSPTCPS